LETNTRGLEITQNTCSKNPGACFFLRSPKCRRQLRHSHGVFGGERARHSHIQQVYRHPTSIQAPYKYTDTLQVYRHPTSIHYPEYKSRHPNTSPDTQTQVQTPKYKSRHLKYKSKHPKYKSRHPNTSADIQNTCPDIKNTYPGIQNTYFRVYIATYSHI